MNIFERLSAAIADNLFSRLFSLYVIIIVYFFTDGVATQQTTAGPGQSGGAEQGGGIDVIGNIHHDDVLLVCCSFVNVTQVNSAFRELLSIGNQEKFNLVLFDKDKNGFSVC